jgi:hypothetical protein
VSERLLEGPDKGAGKGKADIAQQQGAGRLGSVCGVVSHCLSHPGRSSSVDKRSRGDSEHCVEGCEDV